MDAGISDAGNSAVERELSALHYETLPVGVISVRARALKPSDKIARLPRLFDSLPVLPWIHTHGPQSGKPGGMLSLEDALLLPADTGKARLRDALASGALSPRQGAPVPTLPESATIAQARAFFSAYEEPPHQPQSLIPLVDVQGRYTGRCASRTLLIRLLRGELRPERVGGLATPLGVFMTSGQYMGGAGIKGLIALGIVFGVLVHVLDFLHMVFFALLVSLYPAALNWSQGALFAFQLGFLLFASLAAIRLTPISGLHAAEHMTINALEQGLPIEEAVVQRQPREHLRCGTNLMVVLAGLQAAFISLQVIGDRLSVLGEVLYIALWVLLILKCWRPAGLWLQRNFTTRPPTPAQLESGLFAARDLLEKFRQHPHVPPTFWQKLLGSGFPQMATTFLLTSWALAWVLQQLGR